MDQIPNSEQKILRWNTEPRCRFNFLPNLQYPGLNDEAANSVLKRQLFHGVIKSAVGERQCCRPPCVYVPGQVELLPCDWLMSWLCCVNSQSRTVVGEDQPSVCLLWLCGFLVIITLLCVTVTLVTALSNVSVSWQSLCLVFIDGSPGGLLFCSLLFFLSARAPFSVPNHKQHCSASISYHLASHASGSKSDHTEADEASGDTKKQKQTKNKKKAAEIIF